MAPPKTNLSLVAKQRIKKLGGSTYMALLAKRRHAKLSKKQRRAHALMMLSAKKKLAKVREFLTHPDDTL